MSDFALPILTTAYASFLSNMKDRDVDAITLCLVDPSNKPTGTIRWNRAGTKFQEWDGAAYQDLLVSLAGGGTGSATAAGARTNLGLGSMATQGSGAVVITGGSAAVDLTGSTNVPAGALTGGPIAQARLGTGSGGAGTKVLYDDQTFKTIPASYPTIAAVQTADFTAALETLYPVTGSHTVNLPTVVANAGKRVIIVNRGTGSWTIAANGSETILGAVTYSFAWGQYSAIVLIADANAGLWDII